MTSRTWHVMASAKNPGAVFPDDVLGGGGSGSLVLHWGWRGTSPIHWAWVAEQQPTWFCTARHLQQFVTAASADPSCRITPCSQLRVRKPVTS